MNKIRYNLKKAVTLVLTFAMLITLAACTDKRPEMYKTYIESLITANYLGISDEYLEMTGANAADAEALYLENATRLAENFVSYYQLEIANDSQMGPQLVEISKNLYKKARFNVAPAYKQDDDYYVDIQIYPINIINQSRDQVTSYINEFNDRVKNGYYNNYERQDYEHEFASGIIQILQSDVEAVEYAEPVTVTVKIIVNEDDSYYISDEDFIAIDNAIVASSDNH